MRIGREDKTVDFKHELCGGIIDSQNKSHGDTIREVDWKDTQRVC